ncbi:serine/threonine-protein kinase [Streptosporangium jomthongense]|uniref:non-specific serine/threonine protein kinase n=1 Tax=Streptosporangium jomthongense TaxID=1193683 RepID=A0ABV8F3X6_9ACTN
MVAQGTTLAGRYRLDTRIGAGGMGEVWRGEDIVLARTVAVKVLLPGRTDDPGFLVRFQGEARAMATINHPGVVEVYDYGVHEVPGAGATAYLVMKFVDGEPLDRLLARLGSIAPGAAMELIAQAASALQAVHEQGIVHRDIKPGNLLVRSDGTLVLTDFGIARSDAASRLTDAGMVLGTAAYCAPEQAEGAPVTPAVDIYALGVVAYECLAGQRPFDGDTPVTIALKHIREEPPALPPHIPPGVRALVERALSKDPARRFPSGAAMSAAARQATAAPGQQGGMAGTPPPAVQETAWQPAPQPGPPMTGPATTPPQESSPRSPATEVAVSVPGRGRRALRKPRRKGGTIAVFAVAGVACAGLVGIAINAMAAGETGPTKDTQGMVVPTVSTSAAKPPSTHRPPKTTAPTVRPTQDDEPKPTPTRTPTPTETESDEPEEPTAKPTKTADNPKPSSSPTHSPSATATLVVKKKVPSVMGLNEEAAKAVLKKAGFKAASSIGPDVDVTQCMKVVEQRPGAGTMWDAKRPVDITLVNDACPSSPSPSPSTS